jgi:hypothetical protein
MMPVIASFAALQDWDAVFGFDYGTTQESSPNNAIEGFFALGTNPAKMAFYPVAALMFRQGLMPIAPGDTVLGLEPRSWESEPQAFQHWTKKGALPNWRNTRVGVSPTPGSSAAPSDFNAVQVNANGEHLDYVVNTPRVKGIVGFVGGREVKIGDCRFGFSSFDNGFAALIVAALDQKDLNASGRVLLTLAGRVENRNMTWNTSRTSVGSSWGNGPTMVQPIVCKVVMKVSKAHKVYALASDGKRLKMIPSEFRNGILSFTINRDVKSMWYEIVEK